MIVALDVFSTLSVDWCQSPSVSVVVSPSMVVDGIGCLCECVVVVVAVPIIGVVILLVVVKLLMVGLLEEVVSVQLSKCVVFGLLQLHYVVDHSKIGE